MRRVTEATKDTPVSRHVSCSTFSSRLLAEAGEADTAHNS